MLVDTGLLWLPAPTSRPRLPALPSRSDTETTSCVDVVVGRCRSSRRDGICVNVIPVSGWLLHHCHSTSHHFRYPVYMLSSQPVRPPTCIRHQVDCWYSCRFFFRSEVCASSSFSSFDYLSPPPPIHPYHTPHLSLRSSVESIRYFNFKFVIDNV